MENTPAFILGLFVLILAAVSAIPTYMERNVLILFYIGIGAGAAAGILYLIGGIQNNRNLVGPGFGIGLFAWGLVMITTIYGISWNQTQINLENLQDILFFIITFWLFFPYAIPPFFPSTFMTVYHFGYISCIAHLVLAIAQCTLGIIAFAIVFSAEKW